MEPARLISDDLEPFRSKLYLLNGENGWLDQGTGFPIIVEEHESSTLKFFREESAGVIYQMALTDELQFDQQDEKIFTWYNKRTNVDMALSFQNEAGAEKLWQKINEIIANKRAFFGPFAQGGHGDESISPTPEPEVGIEEYKLLVPNENNLPKFESELIGWSTGSMEKKNTVCHILCRGKVYLGNLIEIFRKAEEAKSKEKLTILFRIFRQMINLAHYDLYSVLLSDDYYLEVFGALEYDPDRSEGKTAISHRKYFQEHAKFNQVGTIKDPDILRAIHWNFRLMYLRDCVLAHYLDERILQFISAIVHSNYIDILKYIQGSREVLISLFESLRARKLSALKMIHEMCLIMKNLDLDKVAIFEVFAEYNMFETFEEIMITPNAPSALANKIGKKEVKKTKEKTPPPDEINVKQHLHMILEVLMLCLVQAPHCLRDYCLSQPQKIQKYPLLTFIVDKTTNHEEAIIQNMLGEVIKHLIDASETEENPLQALFYEKFLNKIMEVFEKLSNEEEIKNAKSVVLDLLIYCAKQQMSHLSKYVIPLDIPGRIFKTFQTNDKFLILIVIQLYKLLLSNREPEILAGLCKPLDYIIEYFLKYYKSKSNLLHSAIVEVFVLIMKEEIYILLNYIMEKHKTFLQDPACSFIANKIREKHKRMTNGETEKMAEEQKTINYPFNLNARKGKANLTIISPFGSVLAVNKNDETRKFGYGMESPNIENIPTQAKSLPESPSAHPISLDQMNEEKDVRRTSSSLAKLVDYDDEMEFNMEARGKDVNFMLEDIQLKKRKLDDLNAVTVINK